MAIFFVNCFDPKVGPVKDVGPGRDYSTGVIKKGLVKIEAIQVGCRHSNAHRGTPDSNHGERGQQKVKAATVIEGSVLKN